MPASKKTNRRKVRTACRTCKVRKVKCDEGWPACRACLSTGRVCDGYGVWGGGGNRYEQRRSCNDTAKPVNMSGLHQNVKLFVQRNPFSPTIQLSDTEEYLYFKFFMDETSTKIPWVYGRKYNNLWESLIVQACAEEPAVLHAALAISSAHRRKVFDGASRNRALLLPDQQEEFMLRNYCKSIEYLQPKYHTCGEHSMRTALITCLVFIYLELLRSDYKRACDHCCGGMKLLTSLRIETNKRRTWSRISSVQPPPRQNQDSIDDFLTEAFARLHLQFESGRHRFGMGSIPMPRVSLDLPTLEFGSHQEARHYLDRTLEGVSSLSQAIQDGAHTPWPIGYWEILKSDRQLLQGSLDSWLRSYRSTIAHLTSAKDESERIGYEMLRIYHTMAEIMAGVCLSPEQSVFDQYNSAFLSIITQSNNIAITSDLKRAHIYRDSPQVNASHHTWPHTSWIPPLYYTALKCRIPHIRAKAVDLMASFWRYELLWDPNILNMVKVVAEEVIRIEEGDFFEVVKLQGDSGRNALTKDAEHTLSSSSCPLPEERRFDAVGALLDDVPGSLQVVCSKYFEGQIRVIQKIYNAVDRTWTEVKGESMATPSTRKSSPVSAGVANQA